MHEITHPQHQKRILVLGATGMLGHMVHAVLAREEGLSVRGVNSSDFDASDYSDACPSSRQRAIFNEPYDYVINCIGMLSPIEDVEAAIRVNALFSHALARTVVGKIINMSTDGVFSGKGGPYDEAAPHDCTDVYGKTKSLGEVYAQNVITFRCSIVGPSPKNKGLLAWFLSQPDGTRVSGYTNHIWHGVTTLQFAELCREIILNDHFETLRRESSVFHFAPNEPVTKYELLCLFKDVFRKDVIIEACENSQSIKRILQSRFQGLQRVYQHAQSLQNAIVRLKKYV